MSIEAFQRTAVDPVVFSDRVLATPLWDFQAEVALSPARYRVICAGRQVGKSVLLSRIILHEAATRANIIVLIVSPGEEASKRLLAECASVARDRLAGSVLDDNTMTLTLSNGSRIIAVPASIKQIRGWPVDLLVVDEAGFVPQDIWDAAEPAIIARPGSRVILVSTPWGGSDHFFRQLWTRGMGTAADDPLVHAWHWPSSRSPLVDRVLLDEIRGRKSPDVFAREYMAEWTADAGSYFTERELTDAVAQYELLPPAAALEAGDWWVDGPGLLPSLPAVGGIDWGMARDANAVVLLSPLEDGGLNRELVGDRLVFFVPWLEARYQCPWDVFIGSLVRMCTHGFAVHTLVSEVNGVGAYPSDDLASRVWSESRYGVTSVAKVWTDLRRKQSGFGQIKAMLQRRQLVLPPHPGLLSQLRGLEFEQLAGGGMRIAVPESVGHDDLAMALMQAVSALRPDVQPVRPVGRPLRLRSRLAVEPVDVAATTSGVRVPLPARPAVSGDLWYRQWGVKGRERGDGW